MMRIFLRRFLLVVMFGIIINTLSFSFLAAQSRQNPDGLKNTNIKGSGNNLLIYADPEAHRKGVEEELARLSKPEFTAEINIPDPGIILQGGDNINDATIIGSLPYTDNGTTAGYTNDYQETCPYAVGSAPDVVYAYSPSADQYIDISLCNGTTFDAMVYVYENDPGSMIACNDDNLNCPDFLPELYAVPMEAGNTYYIVVDGSGDFYGSYVIDVSEYEPPDCFPDETLMFSPGNPPLTSLIHTTCGYGNDLNFTCLQSYDSGEDVVVELILSADICLNVTLDPGQDPWTGVLIDDECPPDPYSCLAVSVNSLPPQPHGFRVSLSAGTYYIMVDNWPNPPCITDYDLTIEECPPPPSNDQCTDAQQVTSPYPVTVDGTTAGATIDCSGILNWHAVWYEIELPYVSNDLTVDYCGSPVDIQTASSVLIPDCDSCSEITYVDWYQFIDCNDDHTNPVLHWEYLDGPRTVLLPVYITPAGDFSITFDVEETAPCNASCVPWSTYTELEQCGDNSNAGCLADIPEFEYISCGEVVCGTMWGNYGMRDNDWYEFTLDSSKIVSLTGYSEAPYAIFLIDGGSGDCTDFHIATYEMADACDTISYSITMPAGVHYVWVGIDETSGYPCDVEYWFELNCEDIPGPPDNDLCENAEIITDGVYTGTTEFATFGGKHCSFYQTGPDVWYSYTPESDGILNVSLCESMYDTYLAVYEGSDCDSLGPALICDDDFCEPRSAGSAAVSQGTQYLIQISGFAGYWGRYTLEVELAAPDIEVDSASLTLSADPGGSDSGSFDVSNLGTGPLDVVVRVSQDSTTLVNMVNSARERLARSELIASSQTGARRPEQPARLTIDDPFATPADETRQLEKLEQLSEQKNRSEEKQIGRDNFLRSAGNNPPVIDVVGDSCANPIIIPESFPYTDSGNTCGMQDVCDITGDNSTETIYEMTITSSRMLTVSLCDSDPDFDTKVAVFRDNCCTGPGTEFAYNDDWCDWQSEITANFTPGVYYVVVDGYWGECGDYVLDIYDYVPPVCDPVETLTFGPGYSPVTGTHTTTCGYGDDWFNTCLGFWDEGEDVIVELIVTGDVCVNITLDPHGTGWTAFAIDDSCPVDASNCIASSTVVVGGDPHGVGNVQLTAGTYYILIDMRMDDCIPEYTLTIEECPPAPSNDNCSRASLISGPYPATVQGTTRGATIDCPGVFDWEAVWYKIDLPYAQNNLEISYCGPTYEIPTCGNIIYNNCSNCMDYRASDDFMYIGCSNGSRNPVISWYNVAGPGLIYLPVYTRSPMDFTLTVDVAELVPCEMSCPPGAYVENELCGYDLNGGCNMSYPMFEPFTSPNTICGTAWSDGNLRDTDWYQIALTEPSLVTISGTAEFPLQLMWIDAGSQDCYDFEVDDLVEVDACSTVTMIETVPAGVYWLWVGPSEWSNQPCDGSGKYGNDYHVDVDWQTLWLTTDISDFSIPENGSPVEIEVTANAANLDQGIYTGNIILATNDIDDLTYLVPVTFAVGGELCDYVPGDVNGDEVFNAVDITLGINYFKGGQEPLYECECTAGNVWHVSGDVNNSCNYNAVDITYGVYYFKGGPDPQPCSDCPPINATSEGSSTLQYKSKGVDEGKGRPDDK